jgi:CDP-2,3-bis-(O-geranylgeranyl)-sn-glycerol synthase
MEALPVFLLLLIANGSPILARLLLRKRLAAALDGGLVLADGHRLLGPSKTWRGLITAVLLTTLSAVILGLPWHVGAIVGTCAMLGDALSSFVKRRLGMASGDMAPGLDQIPESLLPLLACQPLLGLSWSKVVLLSLGFMVANLALSRLLFHLGVREHPY